MSNLGPALSMDDWIFLSMGDRVMVQRPNETPCLGTIDDVSEDASIIWVWLDGLGRILVTENDEVMTRTKMRPKQGFQTREGVTAVR